MNKPHFARQLPLFAMLIMGGFTIAQTVDNSGRVFPYNGYLENNSTPAEGSYDLEINVFTSSSGGTACDSLQFSGVAVSQGRFSVLLDIGDVCFSGTSLYLEMAVAAAGETPVPLASGTGGRVLVGSVPSAAQGSAFSRFFAEVVETVRLNVDDVSVENSINFTGADGANKLGKKITLWDANYGFAIQNSELRTFLSPTARMTIGSTNSDGISDFAENISLSASGNITSKSLDVNGAFTQNGDDATLNDIRISRNWSSYTSASTAEISNDTGTYKALMLAGNSSSGERQINMYDNVYVNGDVDVAGILSLSGHLNVSGEHTRSCHNQACNSELDIGSTTDRICFLTKVDLEDIDANGEAAGCSVYASGGNWILRAYTQKGPDADAWCAARCLSWN